MSLRMTVHDEEKPGDAGFITERLNDFNRSHRDEDWLDLTIACRDEANEIVAGLVGSTDWGWLFVKTLWVSEAWRKKGLGSDLMREAERIALARGCRHAWLDTFSFQARGFYEKLGYSVFGSLEDYPPGHGRFFMRKELRAAPQG